MNRDNFTSDRAATRSSHANGLPELTLDPTSEPEFSDPTFERLIRPIATGLRQFTHNSYFTRMWTIQEMVLAKVRLVIYGASSSSWGDLKERVERLSFFIDDLRREIHDEIQGKWKTEVPGDADPTTPMANAHSNTTDIRHSSSPNDVSQKALAVPLATAVAQLSVPTETATTVERTRAKEKVSTKAEGGTSEGTFSLAATLRDIWAFSNGPKTKSFQGMA
jgi:hypothetical protein